MFTINLSHTITQSEGFITNTVDDEIVMMSLEKGAYFSLDTIGTTIWRAIAEPKLVGELCSDLVSQFRVTEAQCRQDVLTFLDQLAGEGMIKVVS